jgi:hypothetical protein
MRTHLSVISRLLATAMLMYATPTFLGVHFGKIYPMLFLLVGLALFAFYGVRLWYLAKRPALVRLLVLADLSDPESDGTIFALWPPAFFITGFVVLCHSLDVLYPELTIETRRGFFGSEIEWVLFGFDQLFRVVFLDFFEIFHIHVSAVQAVNWFYLNTIIFLFRSALTLFLIKLVISVYAAWPKLAKSQQSP